MCPSVSSPARAALCIPSDELLGKEMLFGRFETAMVREPGYNWRDYGNTGRSQFLQLQTHYMQLISDKVISAGCFMGLRLTCELALHNAGWEIPTAGWQPAEAFSKSVCFWASPGNLSFQLPPGLCEAECAVPTTESIVRTQWGAVWPLEKSFLVTVFYAGQEIWGASDFL